MDLNPENIKLIKRFLKVAQLLLICILLIAIWANGNIPLWQKVLALVLSLIMIYTSAHRPKIRL
jgi:hypothetical protein